MKLFIFLFIVIFVPHLNAIDLSRYRLKEPSLNCTSEELHYQDLHLYKLQESMFINCDEILSLNLTQNSIRYIGNQTFKKLKNLRQIDISSNLLTSLPTDIFFSTEKLVYVYITKNNITSLQRNLVSNLPYLQFINFAFNNINYIAENCFVNVPSLNKINLAFNNLKTLQFNIIDDISTLSVIYLFGNEWNCDIKLCEFMNTVVTRFWQEPFVPYCHSPNDTRGSTFKEVVETPLPSINSNVMYGPVPNPVILTCHTCSKNSLSWQLGRFKRLTNMAHQTSGKYSTESTLKIYGFSNFDVGNYTCYVHCPTCESSTWINVKLNFVKSYESNGHSNTTSTSTKVIFSVVGCALFLLSICCAICKKALLGNKHDSQSTPINRFEVSQGAAS